MVLALLAAVVVRPSATAWPRKAASLLAAGARDHRRLVGGRPVQRVGRGGHGDRGLGHYSMNLFSPITQAGWSQFLPDIPRATAGQDFEGFQYLGLGGLLLLIAAVVVRLAGVGRGVAAAPPAVGGKGSARRCSLVALLMAMFALSPRVTAAGSVLIDLSGPWAERFAVFRATGRFFWPLGYLLMASALATIATRLPSRVALTVLLTLGHRAGAGPSRRPRGAPPRRPRPQLLRMGQPDGVAGVGKGVACVQSPGDLSATTVWPAPIAWEPAAYQAGLHGLTLNAGGVARPDDAARLSYCHDLGEQVKAGRLDPQASTSCRPRRSARSDRRRSPRQFAAHRYGVGLCVRGIVSALARSGAAPVTLVPCFISIVVPAYREQSGIATALREIRRAIGSTGEAFEIIVVDDGSTDGTWEAVSALAAEMPELSRFASRGISAKRGRLPPASTSLPVTRASSWTRTCNIRRRYCPRWCSVGVTVVGMSSKP